MFILDADTGLERVVVEVGFVFLLVNISESGVIAVNVSVRADVRAGARSG